MFDELKHWSASQGMFSFNMHVQACCATALHVLEVIHTPLIEG